jgi:3-dehydroquinate synthase
MTEISAPGYPVIISKGIAKEINRFFKLSKNKYSGTFILVDENSLKCCYPQLVEQIELFKDAEIIEIESGEASKNIEVCVQIWNTLSEFGADRRSLFVNLGGGVISDMGGFIASTFKRGIDFINIPTTLLSQVDASVGGKTGIDLNHLKNEIGVFCNPKAVFIDSNFLNTLDKRQLLSGFAEVVKHALISDAGYWEKVKQVDFSDLNSFNELIETSVRIKNTVVTEDPKEEGLRKILNFGHTVGHAIETFSLETTAGKHLLHGEAIAVGMICEAYISNAAGKLTAKELEEITGFILEKFKPVKIGEMDSHRLIELMKHDKKNEKGDLYFSLLSSIGKCEINKKVKADLIIESLKYYSQETKRYK